MGYPAATPAETLPKSWADRLTKEGQDLLASWDGNEDHGRSSILASPSASRLFPHCFFFVTLPFLSYGRIHCSEMGYVVVTKLIRRLLR